MNRKVDEDFLMGNVKKNLICRTFDGAKWVTHPIEREEVLLFEKGFCCEGVLRARLLICGLGFFDASINGKRVDDSYFKPIFTDYDKRNLDKNRGLLIGKKQTFCAHLYDVTDFLISGDNSLKVTVGNGYYHNVDRPEEPYFSYGEKKLIFKLVIETDGFTDCIVSDETVKVKYLPINSSLYENERIDFSAKEEEFVGAALAKEVKGRIKVLKTEKERLCDKVDEQVYPVLAWWTGDNLVYDFGKNHSGGVAFTVKGERGRKLRLRFAEVLDGDWQLNTQTSTWDAFDEKGSLIHRIEQGSDYVLSGGQDEIFPIFSWKCYRYVEIVNARGLAIENFRSLFIHTDIEKSGSFSCSDKSLNDLYSASRLSILNNMHAGVVSDCPHREKRPYTGDGQLIVETLLYDLESETFLNKWLWDIVNSQTSDGFVPYTAPYVGGGGGYAWSYALVEVADQLYKFTGEKEYVRRVYNGVIALLKFFKSHSVNEVVTSSCQPWCLGDWLAPEITEFNIPFMSTLFYYKTAETLERFSRILENGREREFSEYKERIKRAINEKFFDSEKVCYCNGIQGENVLPLAYGVVPKEYEARLREKVKKKYLVETKLHLDTGIVATPVLLEYLTENQMEDIAFAIMTQKDYPSYSFMLEGETTLCEHWSKRWPDYHIGNSPEIVKGGGHLSHCHPMFGSVVAWLYKRVAGIDLSKAHEGFVYFTPRFADKLTSASARVNTRFGKAEISWNNDGKFTAEITVPRGARGIFDCKTSTPLTFKRGRTATKVEPTDGRITFEIGDGNWTVE